MKKIVFLSLLILITISPNSLGQQVDLSKYNYQRDLFVSCSEFQGYANFITENDLMAKSKNLQNIYIDSEYYLQHGSSSKNNNWYVSNANKENIEELKKILNADLNDYYVSNSESIVDISLKNPTLQNFDEITILLSDSQAKTIEFYSNGVLLNPSLVKDTFEYTFLFDKKITSDNLQIKISFEKILKISEIEFLDTDDKTSIYFYVNNECARVYKLYYGNSGGSFVTPKNHESGKTISATLSNEKSNPNYISDIDGDGIPNEIDNCDSVSNSNQKDINYNGIGDACEDSDIDGIINQIDNCKDIRNYDQADIDNDEKGDACDPIDNRFSEQNKWLFYLVTIILVAVFGLIGYKLFKK